jgi:hypothetical protein
LCFEDRAAVLNDFFYQTEGSISPSSQPTHSGTHTSSLSLYLPRPPELARLHFVRARPPPSRPVLLSGGGPLPAALCHHLAGAGPQTTSPNSTSPDPTHPRCLAGRRAGLHPRGGPLAVVPASTRRVRCSYIEVVRRPSCRPPLSPHGVHRSGGLPCSSWC